MSGGDVIAIGRRRAELSQRSLARRLGVPQSTVARWEAGDHEPSLASVERALEACGLAVIVGIANGDDSYAHQIAAQLRLSPSERVRQLGRRLSLSPVEIAGVLAVHEVRYVLIGEVAGAVHGWPITLDSGDYLLVPDDEPRNLEALERAAASLGGTGGQVDDPFGGFDTRLRWNLLGNQALVASVEPAGSRGYRDLLRDAEVVALDAAFVQVASLRDLIRLADASLRERDRAFTPALWATLDQTRLAEHRAA